MLSDFIGEVSLKKSGAQEIRLVKVSSAAFKLKDSDIVFFRTRPTRASYQKRKRALERLLESRKVCCLTTRLVRSILQTGGSKIMASSQRYRYFTRYDREDQHGNKISLNEQQRKAFNKLVNNGPLPASGPPGTGKTEFIAAFVHHYLIEKQNTKRILLVSQSHEAVNTAAERIEKHCSRLWYRVGRCQVQQPRGAVSA